MNKPKPFMDLIQDPILIKAAVEGVTTAVAMSYISHPMRNRTDAEDARRARICMDLIRTMKGELKWSVQKAIDTLPDALQTELSGTRWMPPNARRKAWFAPA